MISLLIILFGLTMLYAASTSRIEAYIKILIMQGSILFLMILSDYHQISTLNFIFLVMETLGIKTILIPIFLYKILRKTGVYREIEPYLPNFYSLVITTFIFLLGFMIAFLSLKSNYNIKPLFFGVSISTIITALFIITSGLKIITHVMAYMMLENGIFLLSLSIAHEMPMIVNMGVLLDLFLAIFLLGIFVYNIKRTFNELDITMLSRLKD